jgi:hypothetical protein
MSARRNKIVKKNDFINFDENLKTFRLYAGNSLYSFCISPEMTLEHLYWGKKLQEGYDLRFFSQGCRVNQTFTTVEAPPHALEGKIISMAESLEEVQKTWKESKSGSNDDNDYFQKKRLENYSWRIMSKLSQQPDELLPSLANSPRTSNTTPGSTRRKSLSVAFHEDGGSFVDKENLENQQTPIRRRSFSNAPTNNLQNYKVDPHLSFQDLKSLSKLAEEKQQQQQYPTTSASPSPSKGNAQRFLENLAKDTHSTHYKSRQTFERQLGKLGKGALCVEYSDHGTGDFRTPSFIVVDNYNGSAISPLRYRSHKIYKGKLPLEGMPSIRCLNENEASTLVVTMVDAVSGLEVDLIYGKPLSISLTDFSYLYLHFLFRF